MFAIAWRHISDLIGLALILGLAARVAVAAPPAGGELESLARVPDFASARASSCADDWRNVNMDARPVAPGQTLVLGELEGPGVIRHFWTTMAPGELGAPRLLVLRMYWDGETSPSVQSPLGDFFAVGHGLDAPLVSGPVVNGSDGRARNCYWSMPFRKSARVTVTNEGAKPVAGFFWQIDWRREQDLPADAAYFHAMYRQEKPAAPGRNYPIADIAGAGKFVGTVLSVRQSTIGWWGEGDDFFFIDGEAEPRLRGTGSEDYFCDAWGLRPFASPYFGTTVMDPPGRLARTTAYRWHVADPVAFRRSLRVEIEHKGPVFDAAGLSVSPYGERDDDYASVAFWYQTEPHKAFPPLPPARERLDFDPAAVIEAEGLLDKATAGQGTLSRLEGPWSGGAELAWFADKPGAELSIPLRVQTDGVCRIVLHLTHSWDYGIFQPELDGQPLGEPLDLYRETFVSREHSMPATALSAGPHRLTMRNTGKNPHSANYGLGWDCLLIEKE
jgi:hypothetical protein